jgi:hypothetical protein
MKRELRIFAEKRVAQKRTRRDRISLGVDEILSQDVR